MIFDYIKNPEEIYKKSFDIITKEACLDKFSSDVQPLVIRLIHACGITEIVHNLVLTDGFIEKAKSILQKPCNIFCDTYMVTQGIIKKNVPEFCEIKCFINEDKILEHSKNNHTTKAAAAVDFWNDGKDLQNSIIVIGNAPTALFRLLEKIYQGLIKPGLICAFPVGFVGAIESKQALIDMNADIPFITLKGRLGGSAMASAVLNSLLIEFCT
ncbi:MAG: precorrin-8X methylmutase [Alphaproteobacteria bacterium]|nr:precorrin-8X methylmutase [Alphaproteobacteria bacterium]